MPPDFPLDEHTAEQLQLTVDRLVDSAKLTAAMLVTRDGHLIAWAGDIDEDEARRILSLHPESFRDLRQRDGSIQLGPTEGDDRCAQIHLVADRVLLLTIFDKAGLGLARLRTRRAIEALELAFATTPLGPSGGGDGGPSGAAAAHVYDAGARGPGRRPIG